jgi:DNA polymerase-3 subunit gamma/tau
MAKLALYRKYRPMIFDDLVGQDHVRNILKNAVEQGKISHAYIFSGPRGTGKTSAARILARAINCEAIKKSEPCNKCNTCKAAIEESLTDLIEMDAASHTGVDDMRDLIEKAQFSPTAAKRKVYIIDEVHMLSKSAFNALLKTLEEPPENTHFILATTEAHKILDTIISRCQRFDFHRIGPDNIFEVLKKVAKKEGIKADEEALRIIAYNARGSLRDALSIFEQIAFRDNLTLEGVKQGLGMASSHMVKQFVDAVKDKRVMEALTYINDLLAEGIDLMQFVSEILMYIREEMLEAVEKDNKEDAKNYTELIDIFYEASYGLKDAVISQLPLEMAVVKACKDVTFPGVSKQEVKEVDQGEVVETKEEVKDSKIESKPSKKTKEEDPEEKTLEKIIEAVEKPSVRTLLKDSVMTQEKKGIVIRVGSDFAKKQLEIADNNQALSEGFKKVFGDKANFKIAVEEEKNLSENDVEDIFGK